MNYKPMKTLLSLKPQLEKAFPFQEERDTYYHSLKMTSDLRNSQKIKKKKKKSLCKNISSFAAQNQNTFYEPSLNLLVIEENKTGKSQK